ncbi:MAG: hypothetical protein VX871_00860 [Pseudomonadota bacterium]|nr:hypothetical protein [Pseudomonadota bacterium]
MKKLVTCVVIALAALAFAGQATTAFAKAPAKAKVKLSCAQNDISYRDGFWAKGGCYIYEVKK